MADYNGAVVNAIKPDRRCHDPGQKPGRAAHPAAGGGDWQRNAQKAFKLSPRTRYRSGLSTQIPLLTAECTLLQARQALAGRDRNQGIGQRITLLLTVGGGF